MPAILPPHGRAPRTPDIQPVADGPKMPMVQIHVGYDFHHMTEKIDELDKRTGWPADLRLFLDQYPREVWPGHVNLGPMAQFWLQRHDMFRTLGDGLRNATDEFRGGTMAVNEFRAWFVPRLQFFLQQLDAHHQVEDHHYFPRFRAAETRLEKGFEVLEFDHELIHGSIIKVVGTANTFLQSGMGADDAARNAGDHYAQASAELLQRLMRHLDDEEDLIVPLILERTEHTLGVA